MKLKSVCIWPIIFVCLSVLDMLSTYYVTPDLKNEGNPIAMKYNLSWLGFLGFIIFTNIFWIGLHLFHCYGFKYLFTEKIRKTPQNYLFIYLFNQFSEISYKKIINSLVLLAESLAYAISNFWGYFWIRVLCYTKLYAIADNIIWGFFERHFRADTSKNGYIFDGKSFIKNFDFIVELIVKHIRFNNHFDNNWFPIVNNLLMFLIVISFAFFEKKRIDEQAQILISYENE